MLEVTKVKEAMYYAIKLHSAHSYGEYPYIYHLDQVIHVLSEFGFVDDKYVIAAYLHDTIEDCGITYNDVNKKFGKEIADIVWAVSGFGINRKERFECVVPKIRANEDALIIKLADRISNFSSSTKNKPSMAKMYAKEYDVFMKELYVPDRLFNPEFISVADPMWNRLSGLMLIKEVI
jgi:(p)ppGpp synthase/HD superfamily hydrolase